MVNRSSISHQPLANRAAYLYQVKPGNSNRENTYRKLLTANSMPSSSSTIIQVNDPPDLNQRA